MAKYVPLFSLALLLAQRHPSDAETGRTWVVQGNDSAAIMAAIGQSGPGDTVRLPAGTYRVSEAIRPKSGTKLVGAGQGQTVLRFTGDRPAALIRLSDCEGVEVSAMTLDGAGNPNATAGVFGSNARKLAVHLLTIKDLVKSQQFGPHGVHFSGIDPTAEKGVTDSEISDCRIENVGVGAKFGGGVRLSWGSSRNRVLHNTIRDSGRGGIFGDNRSTDLVIRGNTVSGSGGEGLGIEVWGGCHRAVIEDNRIDHWLSLDSSDYGAVRRNTVSDKSGTFKYAGLELVNSNDCMFTDNTIDDGQQIGISVSGQAPKNYVYWGYNRVQRCNQWGAQLQGEAGGIVGHYFYRCQFLSTSVGRGGPRYPNDDGRGFRTNGDVRNVTLEECEVRGNDRSGVQLGGRNVDALRFVRCGIRDNQGPAVTGPANYTALEWADCQVSGNGTNDLPPAKPFPAEPPDAKIVAPEAARVGEPVRFASAATAVRGKVEHLLWDFNDGVPVTGPAATHTYRTPGLYRVTLLAWDSAGRGARAEIKLKVSP